MNPATKAGIKEQNTPLHEYGQYILTSLPKFIQQFSVYKDELTLYTAPSGVIPVLTFLRDHTQCQYKAVMDLSGVDYPSRSQRFEVCGLMLSRRGLGLTLLQGRLQPPLHRAQLAHPS